MHFNGEWIEHCKLRDGRQVVLRLLRASDRGRLRAGFFELSAEGRYRRFLAAKTKLSEAELDYLCDVDQQSHVAIGAAEWTGGEEGRGLGVARYVAMPGRPDVADAAVTVLDDAQGVGLGTLLFNRLVEAARERGVRAFHGEVLAKNAAMLSIMRGLSDSPAEVAGGVAIIEFDLPAAPDADQPAEKSAGHRVLKLAAERGARVRRFLAWLRDASDAIAASSDEEE